MIECSTLKTLPAFVLLQQRTYFLRYCSFYAFCNANGLWTIRPRRFQYYPTSSETCRHPQELVGNISMCTFILLASAYSNPRI